MIGKAQWFVRRRYTGWGIMPKTWQGVAYIVVAVSLFYLIQALPIVSTIKIVLTAAAVIIFLVDILSIMASMKLDEREAKIEAIAERNAAWTMVATLATLAFYFAAFPGAIDPKNLVYVLVIPIGAGVVVKAVSNIILDRKGL